MASGGVVGSLPDVCGGCALLKGHRIEVSNLGSHLPSQLVPRKPSLSSAAGNPQWEPAR